MISVSDEFKQALEKDDCFFAVACTITLQNGTILDIDDSKIWSDGFVIDEATSNSGSFDVGAAIIQKLTLRLNNISGELEEYDFSKAKVSNVKLSVELPSGKTESIQKGIYTVDEASHDGDVIVLECLDNMHKTDASYQKSQLIYPATLLQIVQDICTCCDLTLAADSIDFENCNYTIEEKPSADATFRDVLIWVGQISGHYWRCNNYGQLTARWYSETDLEEEKNVHVFKENTVADIDPDTDDVVITNVRIITENENSEEVTFQDGSDGYTIEVSDNALITEKNGSEIAQMLGLRVIGLRFRPLTLEVKANPRIEAGDGAVIYDGEKKYKTFLTNCTFSADGNTQLKNEAESAIRNSAGNFSRGTQAYRNLRKQLQKNRSEFSKALEDLAEQINNSNGLYPITIEQEDGSSILYFCDAPELKDAKAVIKLSAAGWAMSSDGGKTWNSGALVDGEMIAKLLAVQGINAEWINTGALRVLDTDGKETLYINADTGEVRVSPTMFSISGKSVGDIANAAVEDFVNKVYKKDLEKLQNQIDGKVEEYYYAYEPTLDNLPASEWTTDEDKKAHEGDKFFDKSTGHAYRFFKNDETEEYEWTLIQDADVIEALNKASRAQETADGKRRTFLTTPQPPYDPGDLWVQGSTGDIMVCKKGREKGTAYQSDDWEKSSKYTDDTKANEALEAIEGLKTVNVVLSNENQTISTDADGNCKNFPEVATTVSVFMGSVDVTDKATYTVTKSSEITGSWNLSTKTYTVTALSTDSGYVDISAIYSKLKGSRRFTIAKLKAGATGPAGIGVEVDVTSVEYQVGNSGTVKPTGSWSIDIPDVPDGKYLWTRTSVTYSDGKKTVTYTVSYKSADGKKGTSITIDSQQVTYQASSSGTTIPTGTWNTSVPSLNSGQYLWTRTMVNYSDGTTTTSYSVSYKGDDGGTWTIEVSSNTIKRGEDGILKPSSITAKAWYQVGKTVSRTAYSGRLYVYTSPDGSKWTQVSKSDTSSSITYDVSKLAGTIYWLKFTLCAAGTDTVIDQQTVQILDDISSLTGAIMLDKLSGGWQGIYQGDDGKYYIDAEYIRGNAISGKYIDAKNLTVTNKNKVETLKVDDDGNVSLHVIALSIAGATAASQDYVNTATAKQLADAKAYANSKSGNLLNGTDLTADDRKTYWNITGSITEGQTDPDGGKNAILITGTESDNYISAKYENNNPVRTKGQYEIRIWLRSSTALKTCISFNRTTYEVSVTSSWKLYKFSIPITVPSKAGQENFTIGGFSKLVKGNKLYIYKPEVTYSYTPEDILNMLTNNGAMDGIFFNGNQLYVKGERISVDDLYAIGATIGGWKINKNNLTSATGNISLTKDGKIKIGSATLYSNGHAAVIKSGLTIYTDRANEFSDGTGELRIYGATSGSGYHLVLSGNDNVVYLQASSSRRYKNHIKDMTLGEAEKLLSLPVVWFRYKEGYLQKNDALYGKAIPGFYAEDVSRLFPECATYDEKSRPEDWNYRMLIPAMMKLIQNLYKEVREK